MGNGGDKGKEEVTAEAISCLPLVLIVLLSLLVLCPFSSVSICGLLTLPFHVRVSPIEELLIAKSGFSLCLPLSGTIT